tara:strand:- start:3670 stop:3954 length:285 start_codon:yes stop_codon:yes gene_type:complete
MNITPTKWADFEMRINRNSRKRARIRLKVIKLNENGIIFRLCERYESEDHISYAEIINGKMSFEYSHLFKIRREFIIGKNIYFIKKSDLSKFDK